MPPTPPPVAFSLSAPLTHVARSIRRAPAAALVPVALLLLPLVPLVAGIEFVLREGGSAALQGLVAGSPPGRPGALIVRPDDAGWLRLAALAALLATALSVVIAAGLVAGAATGPEPESRGDAAAPRPASRRVGWTLRAAAAVWPALFVVVAFQVLLAAAIVAGLFVLARLAGTVQFQLPTVVLVLGLGALLVAAVRASLWPAVALAEALRPIAALRRSWALTRGSVVRTLGAALVAFLAVAIPTYVVHALVKWVLTALAWNEVIALSPLAIDLWALLPVPFAVFALSALWGREAPVLHRALVAFPPTAGDDDIA